MTRQPRLLALVTAGMLGLSACGGGDAGTEVASSPPDGQAPDGQAPDGQAPDGQAPDGPAPDGPAPDGPAPDGQAPPDDPSVRPDLPVAEGSVGGPLPVVTVRDVTNDQWVQFADFAPSDKATLFWFWAPH